MLKRTLLVVALLSGCGCPTLNPRTAVQLTFAPDVTEEARGSFIAAGWMWNAAVGSSVGTEPAPQVVYVHTGDCEGSASQWRTDGTIAIAMDAFPTWGYADRRAIAAHELGHMFGLQHHYGKVLMNHMVPVQDFTDDDLLQFHALWDEGN